MIKLKSVPYCLKCRRSVQSTRATILPAAAELLVSVECHGVAYDFRIQTRRLMDNSLAQVLQIELDKVNQPRREASVVRALPERSETDFENARAIDLEKEK